MTCNFHKYHGTGNDFIIIDNRNDFFISETKLINSLCDRRLGIGADGLILLESKDNFDFSMRYFNSDGMEGSMCGNGGRCISAYAYKNLAVKESICFWATDGEHQSEILNNQNNITQVRLKMKDVTRVEQGEGYYFINTGSPHYVSFVPHLRDKIDVLSFGKKIRYSPLFAPEGTNVDFVEIKNGQLYVRTYERGVEDETLSCGTGVTASAIAASFILPQNNFDIITRGGNLKVSFSKEGKNFRNIWLEGPATHVYSGQIEI